jgi:hypothetical protein
MRFFNASHHYFLACSKQILVIECDPAESAGSSWRHTLENCTFLVDVCENLKSNSIHIRGLLSSGV